MEYDEGSVVHLNSFQDYVMDLKIFVVSITEGLHGVVWRAFSPGPRPQGAHPKMSFNGSA